MPKLKLKAVNLARLSDGKKPCPKGGSLSMWKKWLDNELVDWDERHPEGVDEYKDIMKYTLEAFRELVVACMGKGAG